jgi:hypothetical protein
MFFGPREIHHLLAVEAVARSEGEKPELHLCQPVSTAFVSRVSGF